MEENRKTVIFIGVAVVLAVVAFLMAPHRITPDAFLDQGEPFFPDFTNPNEAAVLEVIEYDQESGAARPFKVVNDNGNWTIPSHHDYPADGRERLAKTAAGVIGIRKDDFRSDNVADHEALGVVDPLDEAAGLVGRGKRVTLKDANGAVLADFIVGNEVEGRQGFRFVRVPDQKRVYAVRMDIDLSTRFEDWIETNVLQVRENQVERVELKDYSINERTMSVDQRDNLLLRLKDDVWKADGMKTGQVVDSARIKTLLKTLAELKVVGVRPKPQGLSASLKNIEGQQAVSQDDARSLQSKGFYFSRDGQLLSNEGELQFRTNEGVNYTLRFGEVVYGTGDAVSAGTAEGETEKKGPAENRYLFVTTDFDRSKFPEPPKPANTGFLDKADSLLTETDRDNKAKQEAHDRWQREIATGQTVSTRLNQRFADWYYVISVDSFEKLHLSRGDLLVKKE
ncbi:MAG: DUF4340 domain-containing protein [candidate division Zixibacteria bacterium]|nr:DUF4340 domain-containing protein [candidate division Zixibacteria bacterium]